MQSTILPNFLTEAQCQQLIELVRWRIKRSEDFDLKEPRSPTQKKTSTFTFILKHQNTLVDTIAERIAEITDFPQENQEPILIGHYLPGQYYKEHWDPFPPQWPGYEKIERSCGGNRLMTFMIYLNTIPEGYGGETFFTKAGLSVRPDTGKAIMWRNLFPHDGSIDKSMIHEGRAPKEPYEKWIATIWIRERKYADLGPGEMIYTVDAAPAPAPAPAAPAAAAE